ncbi:3-deoxy-D-manno-octulosonic acid transferase [Flagellimonas flava]|uniref:3-deoxy-D-manno-octulosonic acid transferase n=1 Tax=Flagellimonas flava TaxID=570519 RepID=UPI000E3010EA|nr:glycosyltransferase N-terminal domain-containing protein [Allomuricauda flava]
MRGLYNLLVSIAWWILQLIAIFSSKIRLFVKGRKASKKLLATISTSDQPCIWMHVASLGEYEQGLPILEEIKHSYPAHKIVLTFFSPSGYEVKKDSKAADHVLYLPMDTQSNTRQFLDTFNPSLTIFIKYEIWPNYLAQLKQRKIPTLLVSAIFSKRQIFFKPWGGFMRKSLLTFDHFFVQDQNSKVLLNTLGHQNVTISGDTRFDRVYEILKRDNQLEFMARFKGGDFCLVAGSTWPEDEKILAEYINNAPKGQKFALAPHTIKPTHIQRIKNGISKKTVCFSEMGETDLSQYDVLIIDTIGLLTKIYSYADAAYVGGAFATGLHNTLEPAVYGIPVLIGPNYDGFKEAEDLVAQKGIHSISNLKEFNSRMASLTTDHPFRTKTGMINSNYITKNVGATNQVMDYVKTIL